jgi:hypothetical protein
MKQLLFACLVATLAAPASAGVQFSTYEGPQAVQTGTGGAKISKDGIDFWTDGTPPRRFQILGFLTDTRGDGSFSGNAIGSSGLAKRVRAAGGDALVIIDQNTRPEGSVGMLRPNGFGGVQHISRAVNTVTTKFAVVRYLPQQ